MIKDKKILLLCKETFSFPMFFLGKELEKNNSVHYFFVSPADVLQKNLTSKETFFFFKKKIDNKNIHHVKDIALQIQIL